MINGVEVILLAEAQGFQEVKYPQNASKKLLMKSFQEAKKEKYSFLKTALTAVFFC